MADKFTPYKHWTRDELRTHLIRVCFAYTREPWMLMIVLAAVNDEEWDPIKEFDGCSVVQDPYHPCPECITHDWMWRTGMGGRESDFIFFHMMKLSGMSNAQVWKRWLGVRLGWFFKYKWYHGRRRNVRPLTPEVIEVLKVLGYKGKILKK